jgi:hypothetical protein
VLLSKLLLRALLVKRKHARRERYQGAEAVTVVIAVAVASVVTVVTAVVAANAVDRSKQ